MINVENDYEPIIYEQPIYSHIYQNNDQFPLNYYTRTISNNKAKAKIEKIVEEITWQIAQTQITIIKECSNTNNNYPNIPKEPQLQKEKFWTKPLLLESPKTKQFQTPELEEDFLIDSRAESNIINILTWNEIKILHPKLIPFKTTSRLADAQGSNLMNYGKIQLFVFPTQIVEQNKLMSKPSKQTFLITDIKHNIIGKPFITKYIPTMKILNF